eukprot:COSAG02_NODE_2220_length_9474_cov_3.985280_6_plen_109_part_00
MWDAIMQCMATGASKVYDSKRLDHACDVATAARRARARGHATPSPAHTDRAREILVLVLLSDPAPYTSAPRVKIRRPSTMHNAAHNSRAKAGWTEPQKRQACPAVGWS